MKIRTWLDLVNTYALRTGSPSWLPPRTSTKKWIFWQERPEYVEEFGVYIIVAEHVDTREEVEVRGLGVEQAVERMARELRKRS